VPYSPAFESLPQLNGDEDRNFHVCTMETFGRSPQNGGDVFGWQETLYRENWVGKPMKLHLEVENPSYP
jgi:hypothetical protein